MTERPTHIRIMAGESTLGKSLSAILDAVSNEGVTETWKDYYDSLDNLVRICNTDPNFTHILTGPGFDGMPVPPTFQGDQNTIHVAQNEPHHQVLFAHTSSLAISDFSVEYKQRRPLLYYVKPASRPGLVWLHLSSNTYAHLLKGSYGLRFRKESVEVLTDAMYSVKFYLSASEYTKSFQRQGSNVLSHYQSHLAKLTSDSVDMSGLRGQIYRNDDCRYNAYAIESIPSIFSPDWPIIALDWQTRTRLAKWPAKSLVLDIIDSGCHFVPAPSALDKRCHRISENSLNSMNSNLFAERRSEWMALFVSAEKKLVASWSEEQSLVAYLVSCLLQDLMETRAILSNRIIKMLLFWTFEESSLQSSMESILNAVKLILEKLCGFIEQKHFPDYFIPECNLFSGVSSASFDRAGYALVQTCDNLQSALLSCNFLPYKAVQIASGQEETDLDQITKYFQTYQSQLQDALWDGFQAICRLSMTTIDTNFSMYSLEEAIIVLQEILRMFHQPSTEQKHSAPVILIYLNCLGTLYHAKAIHCRGIREKAHLIEKAHDMLTSTKNMDVCLGRIRLANFHYTQGKYEDSIKELKEVYDNLERRPLTLKALKEKLQKGEAIGDAEDGGDSTEGTAAGTSTTPSDDASTESNMSLFKQCLWYQWDHCDLAHDVVYNKLQVVCCPSVMTSDCLRLCQCPILGERSSSVCSASFHAGLLYALCLAALTDTAAAQQLLRSLEHESDMEVQADGNDKRNAAYMVIIANTYFAMGLQDPGLLALHHSRMILPGAGNPATYILMKFKVGNVLEKIKENAKFFGVTTILGVAFGFLESQLQIK